MKIGIIEGEKSSIKEFTEALSEFCKAHKDCNGCFLHLTHGGCALSDTPDLWQRNLEAIQTSK